MGNFTHGRNQLLCGLTLQASRTCDRLTIADAKQYFVFGSLWKIFFVVSLPVVFDHALKFHPIKDESVATVFCLV